MATAQAPALDMNKLSNFIGQFACNILQPKFTPGGFIMTRSSKKLILIATFVLLPMMAAVSASAQQKDDVNVPFAFVANRVSLPAGHYQILVSDSQTSLTFINMDNHRAEAMLLTRSEHGDEIARGRLKFYVIGNRHILTEVQFAGSSNRSKLLGQPARERIALGDTKRNGDQIEIAMN